MKPDFKMPTHAYVPGLTERHPEEAFDVIKESINPQLGVEELLVSSAFLHGLEYFDRGYFWEAHEVLEPVWLALPEKCPERKFVQGLIQLANGYLKLEMGMPKASIRLAEISRNLLNARDPEFEALNQAAYLEKVIELDRRARCVI